MEIVFIGGTGRCGTNIVKDILSSHSNVAALPFEHRLFIDPDGIIDFYTSYCQGWSPFWADKRIKRLERFLYDLSKVNLFHKVIKKILRLLGWNVKYISPKRYCAWELREHFPFFEWHNEELIKKLTDFRYRAVWPGTASYSYKPRIHHGTPKAKEVLRQIIGNYIVNLIGHYVCSQNAEFFIEDNTWNIFFARELIELLPGCKIVHVYRDPRDVVASFSKQRWCPANRIEAARFYKSMMSYWLDEIRDRLPLNSLYEIKLESLVGSPEKTLKSLCHFLKLPFENKMLQIDLSKSHSGRWKQEFCEREKMEIMRLLGPIISKLGYD